jgi:glycosyltransferase involved in cell wall biosynthesis
MRRILFVLGAGYLPGTITGASVSLHALCCRLSAAGCDPIVVCKPGPTASAASWPTPPYTVIALNEPVEAAKEMIGRLAPDAVVVRGPMPGARMAEWAARVGCRMHIYFTSDFLSYSFPPPTAASNLHYAANSRFLVDLAEAYLGGEVALIPTLVEPEHYRCVPSGEAVLFVNPVALKGVHLAAAVAERLPHRRFLFVRSWPDNPSYPHIDVRLPNVEWAGGSLDMRPLYARTRVLLMPSVWEESSGRVIAEVQVSGIPAVVSDRGGLADSVGPGGIVLSIGDPVERWCEAVDSMFTDEGRYATLANSARLHAQRAEMAPDQVVARFLEFAAS